MTLHKLKKCRIEDKETYDKIINRMCNTFLSDINRIGEEMKKKVKQPTLIDVLDINKENSKEIFKPSKYQQDIFDFVKNGKGNILISAMAGSGKTRTLIELAKRIPVDEDIIFLCFNKSIKDELKQKLPKQTRASTLHGLGNYMFYRNGVKPAVTETKLETMIIDRLVKFGGPDKVFDKKQDLIEYRYEQQQKRKEILRENGEQNEKILIEYLKDVIPQIKQTMCDLTIEDIDALPNVYEKTTSFRLELISDIMQKSLDMPQIIDFVDMMWIPVKKQYESKKYKWIFVDEVQDLSRVQFELIKLVYSEDTRIVAVGDRKQAIYGWRNADIHSMDNFKEYFNAKEFSLNICYRCAKNIVKKAQEIVTEIEAWDKQIVGIVDNISLDEMLERADNKDMILCRTNAPLIKVAFRLIKRNKKVTVRGLDIKKQIIAVIKLLKPEDLEDLQQKLVKNLKFFRERLEELEYKEVSRKTYQEKMKLLAMVDRYDTLYFFTRAVDTLGVLYEKINELFSDKGEHIVCSTVHKAKGLEADNVFTYRYDLMPHPMVNIDDANAIQEERNIEYVAITRAKKALYLINEA